jgi:pilus assembly protein CpaB
MRILAGKGAVVAALALGGLTSYMAWRYVDQAGPNSHVETTPIVVAAMPIPARTVVGPEMLRMQQVPVDLADPMAAHSAEDVVGKVARAPMTTDEPVLATKLFLQRTESGLAFMVPEGMRAVSVNFTEQIGSGGMVSPGDHVDVLGVFEAKTKDTTTTPSKDRNKQEETTSVATIVLPDVQVLAVAQHLEGESTKPKQTLPVPSGTDTKPSMERSEPAPLPQAKTATLAVSPADALKLVLAEDKGRIRLALRRADDKGTPQVPIVPVEALTAASSLTASSGSAH